MSNARDGLTPEIESVPVPADRSSDTDEAPPTAAPEYGGRAGPEPTRYGDWEKNGRCIDF